MSSKITHIFLGGGGGAENSKLLDEQFVKMLDSSKPLIYIPNAMKSKPYQSCLEWFRLLMIPLGVKLIEMWDNLRPPFPITKIAGIYIGGGDTAKLLKEIREAGFEDYIHEAVRMGVPVYGGSAGAIILGEDIRTAPEAACLKTSESSGLKIIKGYSIICHYTAEEKDAAKQLSETLGQNIIAIPEKAGGYIEGNTLTNYGADQIAIFRKERMDNLDPCCSIELEKRM